MKKILLIAGLLLLSACSEDDSSVENSNSANDSNLANENNAIDHGMEDKSAGFTLNGDGEVIEADVPEDEAAAIMAAHKEYIEAFNAEDLDRYMAVIAQEPEGFDRAEDQQALEAAFASYDTTYSPSNETIVKYEAERAELFAEIKVDVKDAESGGITEESGRQVVIFKKEEDGWKVSGLHFIGNR
ncbi:YybH family protein [Planococcus beigongshangi]|uniref:YybH family protein n=1 Tax=Planococcus beigongshangi TaxID=2782536 RepID=UPI00193B035C|nr:nuclear transport factor 2 family protein [Planococcus beigongshangi]